MRDMLILRGCPGVGKSTWIKDNGLEDFVVSSDKLRLVFSAPILTENGWRINQNCDKEVWETLFKVVECRMNNGEFIIIDATHCNTRNFNKYRKLADAYGYTLYVKEFIEDLDVIKERNKARGGYKVVDDEVIDRMYTKLNNTSIPNYMTKIENIEEITDKYLPQDCDYENLVFIGDVHGYMEKLEKLLPLRDDTLYVFTGDLIDRGPESAKVLQFALDNYEKDNVLFIEGNHDSYIRNWLYGRRVSQQNKDTYNTLNFTDEYKAQLKKFVDALCVMKVLKWKGKTITITHGGILPHTPILYLRAIDCIKGIGGYHYHICDDWHEDYQVHGHRHVRSNDHSFCLEDGITDGAPLVVLKNFSLTFVN